MRRSQNRLRCVASGGSRGARSPLVVAVLLPGQRRRALVVRRTDLLYLRDGGGVGRRGEGAVRGGRGLHRMAAGLVGVLAVVGAGAGGGAAAAWLRVAAAALLPLAVLQ